MPVQKHCCNLQQIKNIPVLHQVSSVYCTPGGSSLVSIPAFAGRQAHIHCIVSGGGIAADKKNNAVNWQNATRNADGSL